MIDADPWPGFPFTAADLARIYQVLLAYCCRSGCAEADCEDLIQDALLKFCSDQRDVRFANVHALLAYLRQALTWRLMSRNRKRTPRAAADLDFVPAEITANPVDMRDEATHLLSALGEVERAVILDWLHDVSLKEIATKHSISIATAHRVIQRALTRLKAKSEGVRHG